MTRSPAQEPTHRSRRAVRLVGAAMIVGLIGRLAFGLGYWVDKPLTHDEHEYLALARNLTLGQGFRYPDPLPPALTSQQFSRAPGYPFFLAVVGGPDIRDAAPHSSPRSVKVAQAVVGALGILLVSLLAWGTAGQTAGVVAAGLAAVYPPLVWMPAYVLSETLFSVVALATALLLGRVADATDRGRPHAYLWMAVCGSVAGLGALIRPSMLVFLGLAVPWLGLRRSWRLGGAFALGAILAVAPWTLRNVGEHDRLVVVAANGGVNFWIGNHRLSAGDGDLAANPAVAQAHRAFRQTHTDLSETELEPLFYGDAIRSIRAHPAWWVGLLTRKLFYLVVPVGPSYTLHTARYFWASVLPYALLLPLGVAGALTLRRKGSVPAGLALMAAASVVTSLLFFPQERFRVPVLDPTLIVFASVWIAERTKSARPAG